MIKEKRKLEEMLNKKIKELEKFNALYRLITNQYNTFFSKLDINVALKILEDIGIEKDAVQETYKKLIQEEISGKYILVDNDLENKEER